MKCHPGRTKGDQDPAEIKVEKKLCNLNYHHSIMTEIKIGNKKYVLLPKENYQALQKRAALKSRSESTFTIEQARLYSKRLIRKWAKGK
jgi:hypothetical protein